MSKEIDIYDNNRTVELNLDNDFIPFQEVPEKLPTPENELNYKIKLYGLVFAIANSLLVGYILCFGAFMQFKEAGSSSFFGGAFWFIFASIAGVYPVFTIWSLRKTLKGLKDARD